MFLQNLMTDLIRAKLKETVIKHDPNYKSKRGKLIILLNTHYLLFLRDKHERYLSLVNAGHRQSNFANELKKFGKGTKTLEETFF